MGSLALLQEIFPIQGLKLGLLQCLTEADDIKKRWQEYTEELYKKDLHNQDNHDGVITDLEPDIEDISEIHLI